jgi:polygalacturonase
MLRYFYFSTLVIIGLQFLGCQPSKKNNDQAIQQLISDIQLPEIRNANYNILDFGEKSSICENIKLVLDSAISQCNADGGGRITIPKGIYICKGPIHLKSNVHLYFEEGASITFSENPNHYLPQVLVRWEGTECYNYSPFIYANGEKNIAITGKGVFNGNADNEMAAWLSKQKTAQKRLRSMGREGIPVKERLFGKGDFLRPAFMQFVNCENILVSDIHIENMPFWIIQPTYCNDVTIRGININCPKMNNDGVDIDSSEDVLIENCTFRTGDDAIAIKSGRDEDGWRVAKPSRNIVIRNCTASRTLHGIAFGSELSGGIENVYIQNFTMNKVDKYALQFKSNRDRGGFVRNVHIHGIEIDSTETAIFFTNDYHGYSGGDSASVFEHIYIDNLRCKHAKKHGIDIVGTETQPIQDVHFTKVNIEDANLGNRIKNATRLEFDKTSVDGVEMDKLNF